MEWFIIDSVKNGRVLIVQQTAFAGSFYPEPAPRSLDRNRFRNAPQRDDWPSRRRRLQHRRESGRGVLFAAASL
jgi:hypothetical protein